MKKSDRDALERIKFDILCERGDVRDARDWALRGELGGLYGRGQSDVDEDL